MKFGKIFHFKFCGISFIEYISLSFVDKAKFLKYLKYLLLLFNNIPLVLTWWWAPKNVENEWKKRRMMKTTFLPGKNWAPYNRAILSDYIVDVWMLSHLYICHQFSLPCISISIWFERNVIRSKGHRLFTPNASLFQRISSWFIFCFLFWFTWTKLREDNFIAIKCVFVTRIWF